MINRYYSNETELNKKEIGLTVLLLVCGILSSLIIWLQPICGFIICLIFGIMGVKRNFVFMFSSYLVLTFWDNRLYLPGGIPVITILKICLVLFFFINMTSKSKKIKRLDLFLFILWFFYSMWSAFFYSDLSGISMVIDLLISISVVSICYSFTETEKQNFWKKVFFSLFLSCLACTVLGYIEYFSGANLKYVYLSGKSFARFRGVVGVDRYHFIACLGMLYPLYFEKKRIAKYVFTALFVISTLMTISITAVISLVIYFLTYLNFRFKGKNKWKMVFITFLVILAFLWTWFNGSNIKFLNTIILRLKKVLEAAEVGDYGVATSSRTDLWRSYLNIFGGSSLFNKLFGTGITNQYEMQNFSNFSHNTYIDILLYFGLFGSVLVYYRLISSFSRKKYAKTIYEPIVQMKISCFVTGITVSAMTADYWLIFFLL